jgi:hypothetical protein
MSEKTYKSLKYRIELLSHKVGKDGKKSWLRRPKLYKRVVEPYKKRRRGVVGLEVGAGVEIAVRAVGVGVVGVGIVGVVLLSLYTGYFQFYS